MSQLWRSKLLAFFVHVLFSATIIGIFMGFVTRIWFPDFLFELENVWQGLQILVPVDAILGPILTLILFVPGKKGLLGDLIIIGLLQISALLYGAYTIYDQRPEVIVFAGDRFEIIPASKFDKTQFQAQHFDQSKMDYPLLTYALPAQTEEELSHFVINNVQYQKMSERYRPLTDFRETIEQHRLNIEQIKPQSQRAQQRLSEFKTHFNTAEQSLYVIEATTMRSAIIVINNDRLTLEGFLDIDPWVNYQFDVTQEIEQ